MGVIRVLEIPLDKASRALGSNLACSALAGHLTLKDPRFPSIK